MGSRFVRPETRILPLSRGDTLVVKRRLNHGEHVAALARMYLAGVDGTMKVNPFEIGMAMVTSYLLDWSFTDEDGKPVTIAGQPVEVVTAALNALDDESFREIMQAIEQHEREMEAEREKEKNGPGTASGSPVISRSPSGATGEWSGSENWTATTTTSS